MELVQAIKHKQYKQMKALYLEAFPANERKPFWLMKRKQKQKETNMWCIMDGQAFIGLAITMEVDDLVVLDYFAICKELRGKGYGTKALGALKDMYQDRKLILEIEDVETEGPDQEMRVKRKSFYLANGLKEMGVKVTLYGVDMELLGVNCKVTFAEYKNVYTTLYGSAPDKYVVSRDA